MANDRPKYDYLNLGASPANEPCVQLTEQYYEIKAFEECSRYLELLRDTYRAAHQADLPKGCKVLIKRHPHDFGTYYEVAVQYEVGNIAAMEAAMWFDVNRLENWPTEFEGVK